MGGKAVPHPLLPHWRLVLPGSDAVMAREHHGMSIRFYSAKCNRTVAVSSSLEYDRALLLETDSNVVLYEEKPFTLEHEVNGNIKTLIPSFLVLRTDGLLTVEEVTTRAIMVRPTYKKRLTTEKRVLKRYGYRFAVLTEEDIRVPRLVSAKKEMG